MGINIEKQAKKYEKEAKKAIKTFKRAQHGVIGVLLNTPDDNKAFAENSLRIMRDSHDAIVKLVNTHQDLIQVSPNSCRLHTYMEKIVNRYN